MSVASPSAGPLVAPPEVATKRKHRYEWGGMIPFILTHFAVLGAIFTGVTTEALIVLVVLYFSRIFAVTAVYHRYFAHRTYKTSRFFQAVLAVFAELSVQRGVLWWAAHHRAHHLYSDAERDLHSPRQDGFWHAHMMRLFAGNSE